jgi:predicted metal-dependent RNase
MKSIRNFLIIAALTLSAAEVPTDAIVVSTTTKTVVETVTKEWRIITFVADPDTGEVDVTAVYESVVRVDGKPGKREMIREKKLPWSAAIQIAPALVQVREQLTAAMPTILTNTP